MRPGPRSSTAGALLAAAFLLGGCKQSLGTGLPAPATEALQPCLLQSGAVRDHCAVTVAGQLDLTGAEWMTMCGQLGGGTAYDLCVERAAWAEREPAHNNVCTKIGEARTRQSCLLGATNALIEGPIAPLVDVCALTEELEVDCWVHVTTSRVQFWNDKGEDQFIADILEAVKLRPSLGTSVPFASEVGQTQLRLAVPPTLTVCDAFTGGPRITCQGHIERGANPM